MGNFITRTLTAIILGAGLILSTITCSQENATTQDRFMLSMTNKIVVYTYTQQGHDEYMEEYNNEKYFLHFDSTYSTDGTLDSLTGALTYAYNAIVKGAPKTTQYPFTIVKKIRNTATANLYLFALPSEQDSIVIIDGDELGVISQWALDHGLVISKVYYNPNDEVYMKVVINL